MDWQFATTFALVAGCSAYATWSLLPGALRGKLRATWTGTPSAPAAAGCGGCDGCGGGAAKVSGAAGAVQVGAPQVMRFVRRLPGR
jgi:hypothetical protein